MRAHRSSEGRKRMRENGAAVMRRVLTNLLAAFGAFIVLGSLAGWGVRRYVDEVPGIYITGPGNRPAVGAPVFLDRGNGAIERYVTDARGRFSFPLNETDPRRVKWLICTP